jgi:hypothetical protein
MMRSPVSYFGNLGFTRRSERTRFMPLRSRLNARISWRVAEQDDEIDVGQILTDRAILSESRPGYDYLCRLAIPTQRLMRAMPVSMVNPGRELLARPFRSGVVSAALHVFSEGLATPVRQEQCNVAQAQADHTVQPAVATVTMRS